MSINAQLSRAGRWEVLRANPSVTFVQLGEGLCCGRRVGMVWHCGFCARILWGAHWFPGAAPVLATLKCCGTAELSAVAVRDAQCSLG